MNIIKLTENKVLLISVDISFKHAIWKFVPKEYTEVENIVSFQRKSCNKE